MSDRPSYTQDGVTFAPIGEGALTGTRYGNSPTGTFGLLARPGGGDFLPIRATLSTLASGPVSIDLGGYGSDADDLFLRAYDPSNALIALTKTSIDDSFHG